VLGPESYLLLLLVHHIVTDHTSLGVLFEDLVVAYRARVEGQEPRWDGEPVPFVDYALWQQNAFGTDSEWGRAELAYWSDALAGLPDEISMAADHPRPHVLGTQAVLTTFTVPAERRAALVGFAEQTGASEFMVYQAALAVLLHKVGAGTDIPIGSPVAARVELVTAKSDGPFANVVVLRNDLSGDPSLRTLVTRSREVVLDALAHQELPIDRLVETLNPPRSASRNHPFFQASIHFRGDDWALRPVEVGGGTTVVPVSLDYDVSLLDLNVSMDATADGGLCVRVVANADLYEPETVRHLGDGLNAALEAMVTSPELPLSAVELLPAGVMARLLAPPTPTNAGSSTPLSAGSAETERALIALLEELLDISGVERDDNFFALGGDSIVAVQLSARATARGLALTPLMVFEHMTVAELAAAVDAGVGHLAVETDSAATADAADASGLDADALAALTAAWQSRS
jgi:mycobactin peptide synthetase MbtE